MKRKQVKITLLSDTEILKYIAQYLIRGDLACYLPQVVEGFTYVHRKQIGGQAAIQPVGYTPR